MVLEEGLYALQSVVNGKYLSVGESAPQEGCCLHMEADACQTWSQWHLNWHVGETEGTCTLAHRSTGLLLHSNLEHDSGVVLWNDTVSAGSQWRVHHDEGKDICVFANIQAGQFLSVPCEDAEHAKRRWLRDSPWDTESHWRCVLLTYKQGAERAECAALPQDGVYVLQAVNSGRYLTVAGDTPRIGSLVHVWDDAGQWACHWRLRWLTASTCLFTDRSTGLALARADDSVQNGTDVQLSADVDSPGTHWRLQPTGDANTFAIVSARSGKCLNVFSGHRRNGTRVHLWDNPGSYHSHWRFALPLDEQVMEDGCVPQMDMQPVKAWFRKFAHTNANPGLWFGDLKAIPEPVSDAARYLAAVMQHCGAVELIGHQLRQELVTSCDRGRRLCRCREDRFIDEHCSAKPDLLAVARMWVECARNVAVLMGLGQWLLTGARPDFLDKLEHHGHLLALKHYTGKNDGDVVITHYDPNVLTLISYTSPGLELRSAGTWVAAPKALWHFPVVCVIGNAMERASGGYFKATLHRVKEQREARTSLQCFYRGGVHPFGTPESDFQ